MFLAFWLVPEPSQHRRPWAWSPHVATWFWRLHLYRGQDLIILGPVDKTRSLHLTTAMSECVIILAISFWGRLKRTLQACMIWMRAIENWRASLLSWTTSVGSLVSGSGSMVDTINVFIVSFKPVHLQRPEQNKNKGGISSSSSWYWLVYNSTKLIASRSVDVVNSDHDVNLFYCILSYFCSCWVKRKIH